MASADNVDYVYETEQDRDPTRIPDGNLRILSATLLAVLTAASFLGNMLLLVTIGSSRTLRQLKLNLLIANLALVNVLDTGLNIFLSLLYVSQGTWAGFPDGLCALNACLVDLLALEALIGLTLLAFDRAIALHNLKHYQRRMSDTVVGVTIAIVWLLGLCLCAPIAIGSFRSQVFPARYFCAIAPDSPIAYSLTMISVHAVALLLLIVAFGVVFWRAHQDRLGVRPTNQHHHHQQQQRAETAATTNGGRRQPSDADQRMLVIMEHRNFHAHLDLGKFAVLLFVVYFILQAPYFFLNYIAQIRNSHELMVGTTDGAYTIPTNAETSITWLKFVYPVTFPLLVFVFNRDVWTKLLALLCCRKTSVFTTTTDRHVPLNELKPVQQMGDPNVITLVGTVNGLHVKTTEFAPNGETIAEDYAFADVAPERRR